MMFHQMQEMGKSYHIVNAAENPVTSVPVAQNTGVVLRLVSCQVFLAGESSASSLRTLCVSTEEVLAMSLVVFA